MHVFLSAGEPSGDLHGASLIEALKALDPNVKVTGFGGPRMEAAGAKLLFPLTSLAVMWFFRAILNIFTFLKLLKQAKQTLENEKPDAIILIDFPGFNFQLAKRAHEAGIPVYWFVPPQLWAWAGWRVKKMKKWVTKVFTALPFEQEWFLANGVDAEYIGHPYFDELARQHLDGQFLAEERTRPGRVIALLPGSRKQEVSKNLPEMLNAAASICDRHPDVRFLVASFNEMQAKMARRILAGRKLPVEVRVARTAEVLELAEVCLSVSGSVSLEMMYRSKPAVMVYRLGAVALLAGRFMMKCTYITLVNLLAKEEIYPEFLVDRDPSEAVGKRISEWLSDPESLTAVRKKLERVKNAVGQTGACDRAAKRLAQEIGLSGQTGRQAA